VAKAIKTMVAKGRKLRKKYPAGESEPAGHDGRAGLEIY
jgi:hypothetical protein